LSAFAAIVAIWLSADDPANSPLTPSTVTAGAAVVGVVLGMLAAGVGVAGVMAEDGVRNVSLSSPAKEHAVQSEDRDSD
jgi:hypothetical protein